MRGREIDRYVPMLESKRAAHKELTEQMADPDIFSDPSRHCRAALQGIGALLLLDCTAATSDWALVLLGCTAVIGALALLNCSDWAHWYS